MVGTALTCAFAHPTKLRPLRRHDAPRGHHCHQQRDQHVVAGEREAEEAPLHLVAADHFHACRAAAAACRRCRDCRPGRCNRSAPARTSIRRRRDSRRARHWPSAASSEHGKAGQQRPAAARPRAAANATSERERHRQIIGVALLEAERTGAGYPAPAGRTTRPPASRPQWPRSPAPPSAPDWRQGAQCERICGGIERHGHSRSIVHAHTGKRPIPPTAALSRRRHNHIRAG